MIDIWFYHLERRSLDEVLPGLVERAMERQWRALIRTESADRAQAIDALLWSWNEESFLPHAQLGDGNPANQPVLITVEEGNPNGSDVLFLVGGTIPEDWSADSFSRVVVLFDGRDAAAVSAARSAWKVVTSLGHDATYWRQSAQGKWEKQA